MMRVIRYCFFLISFLVITGNVFAQLSPGDLSNAHAHLEGLSNCTKCHVLGEKETTSKCLECHKEIKQLIDREKGYHASSEVSGKKCAECHGEHFGRDFNITRFDEQRFDHKLTGYRLEGKHSEIKCVDCHKAELIKNRISQKKGDSFLGLETECLSCHSDYHQNTLSNNCLSCHNQRSFTPASGFDHSKSNFQLIGKHQTVDCIKCHKISEQNNLKYQTFKGLKFASCTDCHNDVHQNKFGNDCRKCHNEYSFNQVKSLASFNHEKTDFPLEGKHISVDCKKCHIGSLTRAIKHGRCIDCHKDYHENQFQKNGSSPDCIECHSVNGFTPSSFGIEKHNQSKFQLEGAHLATPCLSCHKKTEKWNFETGTKCIDCHKNIHENYMNENYMPDLNCKSCHSVNAWGEVEFDHKLTEFELLGKHKGVSCRECHFKESSGTVFHQQFKWEDQRCTNCHADVHFEQFADKGENSCSSCHTNNNWKPDKFDHNNTRFKLDGKHRGLACVECHKPNLYALSKAYVVYKFKDVSCASCH